MNRLITSTNILIVVVGIILSCQPFGMRAQLVGELKDTNGFIARFGKTSFGSQHIYMNGNTIDTRISSFFFPPPIPVLRLNPNGNGVTIGTSFVDSTGSALSVFGNTSDVHFSGDAIIKSQDWAIFQLDDGQTEDSEKMEILDSDDNLLFRVEEDNSFLVGDLFVEGRVVREPATHFLHIHSSDFEVIADGGGELEEVDQGVQALGPDIIDDGVKSDGSGDSYIGASINVPDGAILKSAKINYWDTDQEGYMKIYLINSLYSLLKLGYDDLQPTILHNDGVGFTSNNILTKEISLGDKSVDLSTSKYYIKIYSDDWDGQGVVSIIIKYIL